MPWTEILGHAEPLERLKHCAARGRLGHTYAFVGPPGIGKLRFAVQLAQCLLCEQHQESDLEACGVCPGCLQVAARTHPDFYLVELPEGKSELSIELFVGDDEHRGQAGLCHDLSLRSMAGRRKIAVINDADLFNEASGNALLKTLEEPPQHSLLILIASSAELLLPTIRSRCQIVHFRALAENAVRQLLLREELVDGDAAASQIAQLAEGSLETARQLLDPHRREQRKILYDLLAAEPFLSVQLAARLIEGLDAGGGEKSSQRTAAGWIVRFAIEFFRRSLLDLADEARGTDDVGQVARFVSRFPSGSPESLDRVARLLERCLAADRQLDQNASILLCLETLCDDLGRLLRA
ncbi:MAG: DNA polymerase III subunit delta' [Planctomycetaceae bacterium]|nr:DNA polymerase III subunit delta' [Planctomycetaceae bacterium]